MRRAPAFDAARHFGELARGLPLEPVFASGRPGPGTLGDTRGAGAGSSGRTNETGHRRGSHNRSGTLVLLRHGPFAPDRGAQFRIQSNHPSARCRRAGCRRAVMTRRFAQVRFKTTSTAAALALAAAILLVPSNLLPVLSTESSRSEERRVGKECRSRWS